MSPLIKRWLIAALLLLPDVSRAQPLSLDRLSWLVGVWRANVAGGELENVYEPVFGNEMMGSLEEISAGKPVRYEMRSIRVQGDTIVYQIVPFGPGLVPGRPIPLKTLISADATDIKFTGAELQRTGGDKMTAILTLAQPNGSTKIVRINFVRTLRFAP